MGSSVILPPPGQPKLGPDAGFTTGSIPAIVSFGFDSVSPPSTIYVQRDDVLLVRFVTSQSGLIVRVNYRLLLPYASVPGQPTKSGQAQTPIVLPKTGTIVRTNFLGPADPGGRARQNFEVPLQEGYLLGVVVDTSNAAANAPLDLYVEVLLFQGPVLTGVNGQLLCCGYVTKQSHVAYPGFYRYPNEGPGALLSVNVANPGAGVDWNTTVPQNTRWRVSSFNAQLAIANAGVARIIRAQIVASGGNLVWQAAAQQTGAINTTVQVSGTTQQVQSVVDTTTLNLPLPGTCYLTEGDRIGVSTSNINAADQWSNIFLAIEEWVGNANA